MSERDPFDDVRHLVNSGTGVLSGDAADNHYRATPTREQEGIAYQCQCDNCGMTSKITVAWDEFIVGKNGLLPSNWKYMPNFGAITPNVGCAQCRAMIPLMITPDDCAKQVKAGIASRQLDANYVANADQQIRARAAGHR